MSLNAIFDPMVRSYFDNDEDNGGGSSDYEGVLCYKLHEPIEILEDYMGFPMMRVATTAPDVDGKKVVLACINLNDTSSVQNIGELMVIEDADEYGNTIKFWALVDETSKSPIVLVISDYTAQLIGEKAGVFINALFNAVIEGYLIFA